MFEAIDDKDVMSLEARIDLLTDLALKIETANGMSKAFALEALDAIPDFNGNKPLAFYSDVPSFAEKVAAIEGIAGGIIVAIVGAVAALVALAFKFFGWLFGDKKNSNKADELAHSIKAQEETLQKSSEANAEWARTLDEMLRSSANSNVIEGEAKVVSVEDFGYKPKSIQAILDHYVQNDGKESSLATILKIEDPLLSDMINHGSYSKIIKATGQVTPILPNAVKASTEAYQSLIKIINDHLKTVGKDDKNPVTNTIKPIEINMFGDGKRITITEGVDKITEIRQEVMEKNGKGGSIPFDKLSSTFLDSIKSIDILSILMKIENTKSHMEELLSSLSSTNSDVEKIKANEISDPVTTKYISVMRDAFKTTRADVIASFKFFHELMLYAKSVEMMGDKLIRAQKEALSVIEKEIKNAYGTIPDEVKDANKKYRDSLSLDFT